MSREILINLYTLTHMVTMRNLEGISDAESRVVPEQGGSSFNFVLGHMVVTRESILKLLDIPAVCSSLIVERYARGSAGGGENTAAIAELAKLYTGSQKLIMGCIGQLTNEELQKKIDDSTLMEELFEFYFHETYHAGQLGILRRLTGKSGALK